MNNATLVTALSHTLIHSLWQGVLLSVITGLVMTCTRKSSSARRYNLLVAAMAMFAVVVAATFMTEFNKAGVRMQTPTNQYVVNAGAVQTLTTSYDAAPSSSITETIGSYLNRYAAIIVWTWMLIVCARCVQLVSGLRDLHRLRRANIFSASSYWEDRVRHLAGQLGVKRLVGIVESARIKTPMVAGHLKPLILVPIGMLTSLSADESEAILLHELAHIRRADYLVNLLQNIMEIVLFFNPAVLWLSALIKAERENCCDDIVLARSNKVTYLNALVACEEYNQGSPAYAMALKGSTGSLKNRVIRIISNKNLSLNSREKSLLAVCLVAATIFFMAFTNGEKLNKPVVAARSASKLETGADRENRIINDMLKDGIITSKDSLSFKIGTDEFVVNYKKQPQDIYQRYRAKYVVGQYKGSGDWIWFYKFDSQKYEAMVNSNQTQAGDSKTGVFRGKL